MPTGRDGLYLGILDVSNSFQAGATGDGAVYGIDLIICVFVRV